MTFIDLGVPAVLARSLADRGIDAPFPIQSATLPDTLAGTDVLGRGRTGSGKTLAFSLPVVTRLAASGKPRTSGRPRSLILAPTRELASQIHATVAPLADALGLTSTTVFGGVGQGPQVAALKKGIDVLVACPGRLEDLIKQGLCSLDAIEITVLDEADHMADLGFLPVVRRLLDRTPAKGQRMLFSATLDNGVDTLVKRYLHQPVTHSVDPAVAPVSTMTHHVFALADADAKKQVLRELASGTGRRVLFTRTKHQAKKLAKQLTADGIPAVDLQGNLGQGARERNLAAFTSGEVRVLVATDIAARGIHVDDVELVVHVDPPAEHKAYLHRSGRTARAGSGGVVVTLQLPEQAGDVRDLTRKAKITVTPQQVGPGSAAVAALVGEVAPRVQPAPAAAPVQGTSTGRNATAKRARRSGGGAAVPATAEQSSGGGRRRRGRGRGAGNPAAPAAGGNRAGGSTSGRQGAGSPAAQPAGAGGQPRRNRNRRAGRAQGPAQTGARAAG
ncbi:DEAD/DEAH box helicase [Cellulomonas denverensis]|uniref:DEAD/DEAH box helicase n=1 Tax=Cellulomonas denverensis TaxID=264297 RepID=A0A7X6KSG5_9CELL|nr:DEAD/DEAH box helicase [Cellulomonas denverensis]NKY21456.1 DEAD/DEAH box helicase [Cellulomonas denverensis]GIG26663.1 putative ATP-dependent RNA helicase [Cellulomonas denverensis]